MNNLYQNNEDISVCFSTDNNYVQHLSVAIVSMLHNTKTDKSINIYVLNDDSLTNKNKKSLESLTSFKKNTRIFFLSVNKSMFERFFLIPKSHFTIATYYRYVIPSMLARLSKLIYLDCDLVVTGDIEDLWNEDVGENYIGAVPDIIGRENIIRLELKGKKYFNAGVLLMNLARMRADNIQEKLIQCTLDKEDILLWQDQDVINMVMEDKIKVLDLAWNFQFFYNGSKMDFLPKDFEKARKNLKIIHYIGGAKPWNYYSNRPYAQEYFKYLKLTPWKNFRYKYIILSFLKGLFCIQNEGYHKTISILGLRIKTKRKYFMLSNQVANLTEMYTLMDSKSN